MKYQTVFFLILYIFMVGNSLAQVVSHQPDLDALETVYSGFENNTCKGNLNWNFQSQDLSTLQGITTTKASGQGDFPDTLFVSGINLASLGLAGNFVDIYLPYLRKIDISNNSFSSTFPKIQGNSIDTILAGSNSFVSDVGNISIQNVKHLDLSNNRLVGDFHDFIMPNGLEHLNFSHNEITGGVLEGQLDSCSHILLGENKLEWFDLHITAIHQHIDLGSNEIFSPFPSIDDISMLEVLDISDNSFYNLPEIRAAMLRSLDISGNKFTDSLPTISLMESGSTGELINLNLSANAFIKGYGNISIPNPGTVNLGSNQFTNLKEKLNLEGAKVFMHRNDVSVLDLENLNITCDVLYLTDNQIDTILPLQNTRVLPTIHLRNNLLSFHDLENMPKGYFLNTAAVYSPQHFIPAIVADEGTNTLTCGYQLNKNEIATWAFTNDSTATGQSTKVLALGPVRLTITHTMFPELVLRNTIFPTSDLIEEDQASLTQFAADLKYQQWVEKTNWSERINDSWKGDKDSVYGVAFHQSPSEDYLSVVNSIQLPWNGIEGSTSVIRFEYLSQLDLSHNRIERIDTISMVSPSLIDLSDNLLTAVPHIDTFYLYPMVFDLTYNRFTFSELEDWKKNRKGDYIVFRMSMFSPQFPVITLAEQSKRMVCPDDTESNNYTWYLKGDSVAHTNVNYFEPIYYGVYTCRVSNPNYDWDYYTLAYDYNPSGIPNQDTELNNPIIASVYTISGARVEIESMSLEKLRYSLPNGVYFAIPARAKNRKPIKLSVQN